MNIKWITIKNSAKAGKIFIQYGLFIFENKNPNKLNNNVNSNDARIKVLNIGLCLIFYRSHYINYNIIKINKKTPLGYF